jgi:Tol biopolymer transport system component
MPQHESRRERVPSAPFAAAMPILLQPAYMCNTANPDAAAKLLLMRAATGPVLLASILAGLILAGSSGARDGVVPGKNGEIVFVRNGRLSVINPNGTGLKQIIVIPGKRLNNPSWSPDGKQIAFDDGLTVYVANADGSGVTDITTPSIKGDPTFFVGGCDSDPTWSPGGSTIAVSTVTDGCTGAAGEIDEMSPTGADRGPIESDYEGLLGGDTQPAWGPGGTTIAITRSDSLGMAEGPYTFNLYLISASSGKVVKKLTRDNKSSQPAFSPDGTEIAFVDHGVITIRTSVGRLVPLIAGSRPAWSPDGKSIVYYGSGGLRIMTLGGKNNHLLFACHSCGAPDWQALP